MNTRFQEFFWQKHMILPYLVMFVAICGILYPSERVVVNADANLEAALYAVILENFRATGAEDLDAMMDTFHIQAPNLSTTKEFAKQVFEVYDLKYEIHVLRYVGQDGDYVIARLEFTTEQVAGPEFEDNKLDTFHVFRQENGKWKIWSQTVLTTKYI